VSKHVSEEWSEKLGSEAGFWRRWFTEARFQPNRERRLGKSNQLSAHLVKLANVPAGGPIRILDVGSGPISTVGTECAGHAVELTCVDALADEYNQLLVECGHAQLPRIRPGKGEQVEEMFGSESFDLVICANALDHFESPVEAFVAMFEVCRTGGAIVVTSVRNEGERQNYSGLHQWNLDADDKGFWLWNRKMRHDLVSSVPRSAKFSWQGTNSGRANMETFRVVITKG